MGIAVVGGLILATGLTLFVVPAVYSTISRERKTAANTAAAVPAALSAPAMDDQVARAMTNS
jgi:hypothetical protein